jgi:hypothetical protein
MSESSRKKYATFHSDTFEMKVAFIIALSNSSSLFEPAGRWGKAFIRE